MRRIYILTALLGLFHLRHEAVSGLDGTIVDNPTVSQGETNKRFAVILDLGRDEDVVPFLAAPLDQSTGAPSATMAERLAIALDAAAYPIVTTKGLWNNQMLWDIALTGAKDKSITKHKATHIAELLGEDISFETLIKVGDILHWYIQLHEWNKLTVGWAVENAKDKPTADIQALDSNSNHEFSDTLAQQLQSVLSKLAPQVLAEFLQTKPPFGSVDKSHDVIDLAAEQIVAKHLDIYPTRLAMASYIASVQLRFNRNNWVIKELTDETILLLPRALEAEYVDSFNLDDLTDAKLDAASGLCAVKERRPEASTKLVEALRDLFKRSAIDAWSIYITGHGGSDIRNYDESGALVNVTGSFGSSSSLCIL